MRDLVKKIAGVVCLAVGIFVLVTPFTPGSWLIFVGLELLGVRILFLEKLRAWLDARRRRKE